MYANFPRYAEVDKDLRNWLNEGNIRLQQLYAHPFTPDMKVYLFIFYFQLQSTYLQYLLTNNVWYLRY